MVQSNKFDYLEEHNQRSRSVLERSLLLASEEFSFLLVRCNYYSLALDIQEQIHESQGLQRLWQYQQPEFLVEYFGDIPLEKITAGHQHRALVRLSLTVKSKNLEDILQRVFARIMTMGIQQDSIAGVMVFGLEQVGRLDVSLARLNQVRDQLSHVLPCPLVLWLTDRGTKRLFHVAPDVRSWAVTSINFVWETRQLTRLWQSAEAVCFERLEKMSGLTFVHNQNLGFARYSRNRLELELAAQELRQRQSKTSRRIKGFAAFLRGRDAYSRHDLETAQQEYLTCFRIYAGLEMNCAVTPQLIEQKFLDSKFQWSDDVSQRLAIILFHLSLLYDEFDQEHPQSSSSTPLDELCLRASLQLWLQQKQWTWSAHLTTALGLMLRQRQDWDGLETLAWETKKIVDIGCSQLLLTRNYCLLASKAIAHYQWEKAEMLAQSALETFDSLEEDHSAYDRPWYYLTIAKAKRHIASLTEAILYLEKAHTLIKEQIDQTQQQRQKWSGSYLHLYRDILRLLQLFHRDAGHYREAFDLQQELQHCEQQWGWQVFFGAAALPSPLHSLTPELRQNTQNIFIASYRQDDIKNLQERIRRDEHKLTVLHGYSGVGKTSLLQAGLIPSLWGELVNARETLPVMLTNYGQWRQRLAEAIATQRAYLLQQTEIPREDDPMHLLQENNRFNLLTVLVFDQFEQFLERYPRLSDRREFFRFLSQCLHLPFVKIVLSLREDYLSLLLEWEALGDLNIINDNLLDRSIRYSLGNLEARAAHNLLSYLSEKAPKSLDATFIDHLIGDLTDDLGLVRPIELQVIGSQLQQNNITTLEKYLDLGSAPKQKILEGFLSQIIHQCGEENYDLAWQFLYRLVSARQTRPEVDYQEFSYLSRHYHGSQGNSERITDLILHIFEGTGLAIHHSYSTQDTYQLVHDYLVQPIYRHYQNAQSQSMEQQLASKDREISRIRRHWSQSVATIVALLGVTGLMLFLARRANIQRERQWQVTKNAELIASSSASEALFYSEQRFEALLESLRATVQLRELLGEKPLAIAPSTRLKVLSTLEQSYFGLQEKNRLEGHKNSVVDVVVSPDGKYLATASTDKTVRLWNLEGELLQTMVGHEDQVTRVVFSTDGQWLFSSSWDSTIRKWSLSGVEVAGISEEQRNTNVIPGFGTQEEKKVPFLSVNLDKLTALNLSPNGELMAIASGSGAEIRTIEGKMVRSLVKDRIVYWIAFSSDGSEILTIEEDNQITIWDAQGEYRQTLRLGNPDSIELFFAAMSPDGKTLIASDSSGNLTFWQRGDRQELFPEVNFNVLAAHEAPILFINFNDNGSRFVTAGGDNLVKVWSEDLTLERTFSGHRDTVSSVVFHPETQQVISASSDKTIRLWEYAIENRVVVRHDQPILDVQFSRDGSYLATASSDNTVRLWHRDGRLKQVLDGHTDWVNSVAWHPDGNQLITGSDDKTVRLWSADGELLQTLEEHGDRVFATVWSPDGELFASAGLDQQIHIWSHNGNLLQTLTEHQGRINSLHFSPDSQLLASASDDQTVKVWQRRSDNSFFLANPFEPNESWVTDVTFSDDGQYLAFGRYDNLIQVLPMSYKNNNPLFGEILTLKGHSDSVAQLQFHPTLPILATSTWNNQLQLWSLGDTLLKSLEGHQDLITGLDWSPDGTAIATSSQDNTVIIWNLGLDNLLTKSCQWLQDYLRHNPKLREGDHQLCVGTETSTNSTNYR